VTFSVTNVYITKVRDRVRSRRARHVYYTTSLEYETEIEGGGCAFSLTSFSLNRSGAPPPRA